MQQSLKINNEIFQIENQKLEFGLDSEVYLGINSKTNKQVTIRLCSIDQDELQTLQNIQKSKKDHLIEIKYLEQTKENQCIIVMEPIKENFYNFMTGNEFQTITKEQKNMFFYQMVLGVKDLHELGIIHRNLKPENFCLIQKNSNIFVKLFNFNLSKHVSQKIKTPNIGTPLYMAPELLKQTDYDFSIDLWSLGCILFELITGDTFFKGINEQIIKGNKFEIIQTIQAISQKNIQNRIDQQQSLDQDEKYWISQLLQIEAKKRSQIWELEKFLFVKIKQEEFQYFKSLGLETIREFDNCYVQLQQKLKINQNDILIQQVQNLKQQFSVSKQNFSILKRSIEQKMFQNQIEIQQIEQLSQVVQQLNSFLIVQQQLLQNPTSLYEQESDQNMNKDQLFQLKPSQFFQFK